MDNDMDPAKYYTRKILRILLIIGLVCMIALPVYQLITDTFDWETIIIWEAAIVLQGIVIFLSSKHPWHTMWGQNQ